jgi:aspartyl-tRNA(Asn)/glutamyl-tRNA(Gln) amidotransferase subunit C
MTCQVRPFLLWLRACYNDRVERKTEVSLTREQAAHVAELAKISLSDEELERMARQLSDILRYAARLDELDTSAIAPTASVIPNTNVMRPDVVTPSLAREQVLANAPDTDPQRQFIRVRAILEE